MQTHRYDPASWWRADARGAADHLARCLHGAGEQADASTTFPLDVVLRPAAVLIALVWHADAPSILLTRRTEHLRSHAGQISFPGGKVEADDTGAVAAALREAREEVGLSAESVLLAGALAPYPTLSGFCIHPVVGVVEPPLVLSPEPGEVAEVFELPLALALDTARYEVHPFERDGFRSQYHALRFGERFIWGATAGMLFRLATCLAR